MPDFTDMAVGPRWLSFIAHQHQLAHKVTDIIDRATEVNDVAAAASMR